MTNKQWLQDHSITSFVSHVFTPQCAQLIGWQEDSEQVSSNQGQSSGGSCRQGDEVWWLQTLTLNSDKPAVPWLSCVALENKTQREIKNKTLPEPGISMKGNERGSQHQETSATEFISNLYLQSSGSKPLLTIFYSYAIEK